MSSKENIWKRTSPIVTRGEDRRRAAQQMEIGATMDASGSRDGACHPTEAYQDASDHQEADRQPDEAEAFLGAQGGTEDKGENFPDDHTEAAEAAAKRVANMSVRERQNLLKALLEARISEGEEEEEEGAQREEIPERGSSPNRSNSSGSEMGHARQEASRQEFSRQENMGDYLLPARHATNMAASSDHAGRCHVEPDRVARRLPCPVPMPRSASRASLRGLEAAEAATPGQRGQASTAPTAAEIRWAQSILEKAIGAPAGQRDDNRDGARPSAPPRGHHPERRGNQEPARPGDLPGPPPFPSPPPRHLPHPEVFEESQAWDSDAQWEDPERRRRSPVPRRRLERRQRGGGRPGSPGGSYDPAYSSDEDFLPRRRSLRSPVREMVPGRAAAAIEGLRRLPGDLRAESGASPGETRPRCRARRNTSSSPELRRRMSSTHAQSSDEEQPLWRKRELQVRSDSRQDQSILGIRIPLPFTMKYSYKYLDIKKLNSLGAGNLPSDFEKLKSDGGNLLEWSRNLQIVLLRENTLDFVEHTPKLPWSPEVDFMHRRAFTTILSGINPALYPSIPDYLTARQVWKLLYKMFHSKNTATTNRLSREFYNSTLAPGGNMGEHLANLRAMREELIHRGRDISMENLMTVMTSSLGEKWEDFIQELDRIPSEEMTVEYLTGRLLEEDRKRKERRRFRDTSRNRTPKGRSGSGERVNAVPTCYKCGKLGHFKRECRQRAKTGREEPKRKSTQKENSGSESEEEKGFIVCGVSLSDGTSHTYDVRDFWLLDSGATSHIAPERRTFNKFRTCRSSVRVANGEKATVTGEGSVIIPGIGEVPGVLHVPSIQSNLLSILKLTEGSTYQVLFENGGGAIYKHGKNIGDIAKLKCLPYYIPEEEGPGDPNQGSKGEERVSALIRKKTPVPAPRVFPPADSKGQTIKRPVPKPRTFKLVSPKPVIEETVVKPKVKNPKVEPNPSKPETHDKAKRTYSEVVQEQKPKATKGEGASESKAHDKARPQGARQTRKVKIDPEPQVIQEGAVSEVSTRGEKGSDIKGILKKDELLGKPLHPNCAHLLHRRMGHPNFKAVLKMKEHARELDLKSCGAYLECAVCKEAKSKVAKVSKVATRRTEHPYQLVHMDIVGPFKPTFGGLRYFLTIVDDHSRFSHVYLMRHKSEAFKNFQYFYKYIQTQHKVEVAQVQSDQGKEFTSAAFTQWMEERGIHHFKSAPHTASQNGLAERKNGVLQNTMKCMLTDSGLGNGYWGDAVLCANYLINRTWSSSIDSTPYYMVYGQKPSLKHLRTFGSSAWVNIPNHLRTKGGKTSKKMRFIGYAPGSKAYKFVDSNHRVVISRSASFEESSNWSKIHSNELRYPPSSESTPTSEGPEEKTNSEEPPNQKESPPEEGATGGEVALPESDDKGDVSLGELTPPSSPQRPVMPKVWGRGNIQRKKKETSSDVGTSEESSREEEGEGWQEVRRSKRSTKGKPPKRMEVGFVGTVSATVVEPKTYEDVLQLPDEEQRRWKAAMESEMTSLKGLNVFIPAEVPEGKRTIGTRWVFKAKPLADGKYLYKARLVAQGYAQRYGEDYLETYSPTVRAESVKAALVTAAALGEEVFQFDVQTAYLHATLQEKIYVRGAPGFQEEEGHTWLLKKSLYGLKQSGREWYKCLLKILNSLGFITSPADRCVLTRECSGGLEKVLVYVDDLLYIGPSREGCDKFAESLQEKFTLKSLGHIDKYLGVQVYATERGFALSQRGKIEDLLAKCRMSDAKPIGTPMQTGFYNLSHKDSPEYEDNTHYRSVIGSLLYIANWSRPDIALSVNVLSRQVQKPKQSHWVEVKRLLRYLNCTLDYVLLLEPENKGEPRITCYADADWAGDTKTRKSTSGFLVLLNGCPIHWHVGQQKFVSCSTAEAEFACLSEAGNDLIWFDALIGSLWVQPSLPIQIMEDNTAAIGISRAYAVGTRSRHIDIRYRNVRQLVEMGFISTVHCQTKFQIADILTKPLPADQHEFLCGGLCLAV